MGSQNGFEALVLVLASALWKRAAAREPYVYVVEYCLLPSTHFSAQKSGEQERKQNKHLFLYFCYTRGTHALLLK